MRRVLAWIGFVLLGIVLLIALAATFVYVDTNREVAMTVTPMPPPPVLGHADLARGRRLFTSIGGCANCHGADGGGNPFLNDAAMGALYAPNLTRGPGGVGTVYGDADYDRAIRRGVRPDGTRLLIMPSWDYAALSNDDAASVIAYIRSLPPVDRATPRVRPGPVLRMLMVTHKVQFDATQLADEGPPPSPAPAGVTAAYGGYLARVGGCMSCHGENLSGGHLQGPPEVPPAANLTPAGIGAWSQADFVRTMRTGIDPKGHALDPFMPWRSIGTMSDDELAALFLYLKSVPPKATGNG